MTHQQIVLWTSAADAFDQRHRLVGAEHTALATPCDEFDVAALIDHAIGTQVSFGQILGSQAQQGASWDEVRAGMATALSGLASLDDTFVHPGLGELSYEQLLAIATNDLLIHTWDLSQALEVDNTLPSINLQPAMDGINAFPPGPRQALFADPIALSGNPSLQDQMLAAAGRQP